MYTNKVTLAFIAAALFAVSCSSFYSEDAQVADLREELKELKEVNASLKQNYIDQNQEISAIVDRLVSVAGRTASLRTDVENGSAEISQAKQIYTSIEDIRKRIDELQSNYSSVVAKNKEFKKMVDGFKKVIAQQETQINELTEVIEAQDKTIADQEETIRHHEGTIQSQEETITNINEELKATVKKQARMLYDAGLQLEEIADNAPEVSWKKNREKVTDMTQDIYAKSLVYFRQAYEAGYEPASAVIARVQSKIQAR